jgi:hypothetical protein
MRGFLEGSAGLRRGYGEATVVPSRPANDHDAAVVKVLHRLVRPITWAWWRLGEPSPCGEPSAMRSEQVIDQEKPSVRCTVAAVLIWLVTLVAGFFIWFFYAWEYAYTEGFLTGNCGPKTGGSFFPVPPFADDGGGGYYIGDWRGAGYESANAAGVVGAALWAAGGVAIWWLRGRNPFLMPLVPFVFVALYVSALFALWYIAAPLIWGPRHCVV